MSVPFLPGEFEPAVAEHLPGWHHRRCPRCDRRFFARRGRPTCADVRLGCAAEYGFLDRRHPTYRPPLDVLHTARTHFTDAGFTEARIADMLPDGGDTFFVIAGVQLFDDVLHHGAPPRDGAYFIAQPSVRLRAPHKIGVRPGILSSFVNLCTEQLNGSFTDYTAHLHAWLAGLLALGLDEDGVTLIVELEPDRRGDFEFRTIDVNYYGFELGEAILLRTTDPASPVRTMLDFGFGFERIVWVVNGADSFSSMVGPPRLALGDNPRLIDFLRTMTLLAAAGLTPANSGRGHVLRRLAKLAAEEGAGSAPIDDIVAHSYAYWAAFTTPRVDLATCTAVVRAEANRAVNARLAARLGARSAATRLDRDPDDFIVELVNRNKVSLGAVRAAMRRG
jgi:hypothetical protein